MTNLKASLSWAADAVCKWAFVTLAIVATFYAAAFIGGCAPACAVINVAHEGCAILKYTDKAGNLHSVQLSHDDIADFANSVAAKRGDAGVADSGHD